MRPPRRPTLDWGERMAPLDTGYVTQTLRLVDTDGHRIGPSSDDYETLGATCAPSANTPG